MGVCYCLVKLPYYLLNTTKAKIGLPPTKSKPNYQHSRPPKKTKAVLHTQKQEMSTQTTKQEVATETPAARRQIPKLITSKKMILCEYPDVFEGIGKSWDQIITSRLIPAYHPSKHLANQSLYTWKRSSNKNKQDVTGRCTCSSVWIITLWEIWPYSFVLVESKDKLGNLKLHICLDPTNLNKAITREPYHFRTPEDIAHLLADACIITVCDCKKGYWHQKLDQASSFLTTFNTEIGWFRYTVMPFGITVAGDVLQRQLDQCFRKIDQLIVISGWHCGGWQTTQSQRPWCSTENLLDTARRCNIRLKFDKLQYKKNEVDFFGETYTTDGCKPTQSKVSAIVEMPLPTCKNQVQLFIGMVNYLSKFSPRLSELVEPIRELSKDKVPFNWEPLHQAAFKQMKKEIVRAPYTCLLQSKERNHTTDQCKYKSAWGMLVARSEAGLLCK